MYTSMDIMISMLYTFDIVDIDDEEEFNTAVKAFEAAMAEEDE